MTKKNCSSCGQEFDCGASAQQCESMPSSCWCAELPSLTDVKTEADCLCPVCLSNALAESSPLRRGSGE